MDLLAIPAFAGADVCHVVIETPRGSAVKFTYEPRWQAMSISRPLPLGVAYPCDWGFVPSTQGPDGDPIDAFVLWDGTAYPGVVVPCRIIGVLRVEQNTTNFDPSVRIRNDRILAVPTAARREREVTALEHVPARVLEELAHFAGVATAFEGKDARMLEWSGAADALALLAAAQRSR